MKGLKSILRSAATPIFLLVPSLLSAQYPGWQQEVDYTMDISVDAPQHQYAGVMDLVYTNHSPDRLERIPFHLFFNAFQPGSMMDVRSRNVADPDRRVGDRIGNLPEDEWGWIKVHTAEVGKTTANFTTDGTIGWLDLPKALAPGKKVRIHLEWDAQVPRQVRRSGWMNAQGVELSMTQWYPKACEYDHHGWHTNPYVGREFHGIWGDFDVTIHLDAAYMVGGTGVLKNPSECGHGYADVEAPAEGDLHWHFEAENVHDFAWAADPDFVHTIRQVDNGPTLHFIHQNDTSYGAWDELPAITERAMVYYSENVGEYPWPQYTVIEGGDGGMEYPMCTLIRGNRNLRSLVGVTAHEMAHAWFQGLLATNESLHEWMDEGFTSWIESEFLAEEFNESREQPHYWAYGGYLNLVRDGGEEPLATHADHYVTNRAYGTGAYSKGEVLLNQLGAIIGEEARNAGVKRYFKEWSFKHPGPVDFKRVMERESGLELDTYFQYMLNSTHHIDVALTSVRITSDSTFIELERIGTLPLPVDVRITTADGTTMDHHIPQVVTQGHRPLKDGESLQKAWPWTHPTYTLALPISAPGCTVEVDPKRLTADADRTNNTAAFTQGLIQEWNSGGSKRP
ncbi:M1 family metallopeptidase [Flavobacteriales bacterium]|nr:M1 family metallopeptidase [Flavobacteriales bacterium]